MIPKSVEMTSLRSLGLVRNKVKTKIFFFFFWWTDFLPLYSTFSKLFYFFIYLFIYLIYCFNFLNFYWSIFDLQCCVSFRCRAKWISYKYIHSFLDSFPIKVIIEYWVEFPVVYSRFILVTYFIYSSVYMSIPITQFIPPFPSDNHKFVFYICEFISVWKYVHL